MCRIHFRPTRGPALSDRAREDGSGAGASIKRGTDGLHAGEGGGDGGRDPVGGQGAGRVGEQLEGGDPDHGAAREAEARGAPGGAGVEEEEGGRGDDGLREARGDAREGGAERGDATRDEDEGDGKAFRDVVDCEGGGDEGAKARAVGSAERRSDAETLREGVQRHHAHHEQDLGSLFT